MQLSEIKGRLAVEPNFSYIAQERKIFMCRCLLADINQKSTTEKSMPNLHILVCFGKRAQYIAGHYQKGQMIFVKGKFLNYNYKDCNGTPHFTNYFLVSEVGILSEDSGEIIDVYHIGEGDADEDEYAISYMKDHGYSMIDESVFYKFEEVLRCYQ